MLFTAQVTAGIHWVGVNDRISPLFERMWPLDQGVAYNSYLIVDEKSALIDTVAECAEGDFLQRLESLLQGRELHYLVINHMEPDHTGAIPSVLKRYPGLQIVGNKKTQKILDSYYPGIAPFITVKDGETLSLGSRTLRFVMTPWVHWPETMMTYETESKVLFTGDAFGSFGALNGGIFDDEMDATKYEDEMRRYYSNIVGKYSGMVQRALKKLADVEIGVIASTHGPIWRENPQWVIDRYDAWSRQEGRSGVVIAVASMYGSTFSLGEYIARKLAEAGVREIVLHDVSKSHLSYVVGDIWNYEGLVLGSVAYNTEMFPLMQNLCQELKHIEISNKKLALFGGYSWNGGGVRNLTKFAEETGLEQVCEPVEMMGRPDDELLMQLNNLAISMAKSLRKSTP